MRTKVPLLTVTLGLCISLLLLTACSSPTRSRPQRTAAIAIAVAGGGTLSPSQAAEVQAAVVREVTRRGYTIAAVPRTADYVVNVRYTPDLFGGPAGQITILGVVANRNEPHPAVVARDQFKEESARAIRNQNHRAAPRPLTCRVMGDAQLPISGG